MSGEIVDATDKLGDDLRELEPPDTEAGDQVKGELDTFAVQLEATATTMKETVDKLPEDAGIVEVVALARTARPVYRVPCRQRVERVRRRQGERGRAERRIRVGGLL